MSTCTICEVSKILGWGCPGHPLGARYLEIIAGCQRVYGRPFTVGFIIGLLGNIESRLGSSERWV